MSERLSLRLHQHLHQHLRHIHPGASPSTILALVLLVIAMVLPAVPLPRRTVEALVVFDITQSMDVEDMQLDRAAVSRLAFARASARRMLRELPCGSRVGWGAFTEYRTLVLIAPIEVCANYGDLLATLDSVDGRIRWGNASEISKGVFWAMRAAKDLDSHPSVVFVTDGQESPPLGTSRFPMFEDLAPGQVGGWLLGVGGSVPLPIPRTDEDGRRVGWWRPQDVIQRETAAGDPPSNEQLSSLHESHLRSLATQVGFDYMTLLEPADLAKALQDKRLSRRISVPTDLAWLPALAALAVLAWAHRPEGRRSGLAGVGRLPGRLQRWRRLTRTSST
jgi:mxaL protein